jgi:ATP-dependent Clp protease ATP-binding subunit ClpC
MGARPLRRAIQRYIEDPLADFVLRSELKANQIVLADVPQGPEHDGAEIELTLLDGVPPKTPVGVGAEGGESEPQDVDGDHPAPPDEPGE